MKRKLYFFDTVCLFALFSLLFAVGFHVGRDKRNETLISVCVTVKPIKSKLDDGADVFSIDGKYPCDLFYFDSGAVSFVCSGKYREAGFLTSGAKYLSKNQPIELIGDNSYIYGRILKIEPIL